MGHWGNLWLSVVLVAGVAFAEMTQLNAIWHGSRPNDNISITLSRQDYTEQCYLLTPQGDIVNLNTAAVNGVTVYPTRTNFVSCRVVIGPMNESLLGIWTLCGRHTVGATINERCQPANITWATNDPAEEWISKTEDNIALTIHNGFSISPIVRGGGGIQTCHVITPAGEDIALTADSDYPGLQRVLFEDDVRACSVNFGTLNANFQGSWVLYGKFISRTIGFNVATQPMTLSLPAGTDGNNDGNSITLTTIDHFARLGTEISITLSRKDYTEECHLQTPNGNTVQLGNAQIPGVKVYNSRTNFVSCRVVIGPMAENLLGIWTLCGKHTVGATTYERCQPANITWATDNPADEWVTKTENNIVHNIHNGFSLSPLVRGGGGIRTCHVITPAGEDIALTAESDYPGLRRVLFNDDDDNLRSCGVNFGPLNANFQGSWVLYGKFNSRTIGFNVATQPITLSLPGTDGNNNGNPITLKTINHFARLGSEISITLSRKDYSEECHLQTPNDNIVQLGNAQINGVKVYNTRTNFVSCRVVIGPMAENLLGIWTLCGKHTIGAATYERCQPANITWATSNPADEWISRTEDNINHAIHNGFSLSPIVRGGGGIQTCHVITPAGEDIALTADSDYPGLQRVLFEDDVRACSVNFGPLNANFQGSWVLYGKFISRTIGFNVATQPTTLSLPGDTDGNNDGNPITLTTIDHFARLGTEISVTLSRKDYAEECHLQTPNGNTVQLGNAQIPGVKVYNTRTNFVSCRVVIGPMAENLLGIWTLCGKHTVGATTYERCQPANITWATDNPADEWITKTENNIVHNIHNGFSLSPLVRGGGGIRTCHVITPAGEDIALTAESDYPGLRRVLFNDDDDNLRSCGVNFGPLNANFQGSWFLYGKFNSRTIGFNVATQPITFSLPGTDGNNNGNPITLTTINHFARLGSEISITLSRKDYSEECHLQTPNGNTVQLGNAQINGVKVYNTRTNFVSCRVVIGPMAENLLGIWTLCGKHTIGAATYERCQPANITWATSNPADEWISRTEDNINHAIHNGFSLSPIVRGGGGIQTCHVITPAGEDIALTADSDYPGLQRVLFEDDVRACSVNFGPLNANFQGSWVLYGKFISRTIGFNVATQPMTLSLPGETDGNNDGNPITLTTIDHFARLGTEISVTLSRKDYAEECHLQTPNGNTVQLGNAQIPGVKVYNTRTNFVSCRVVIGPMAENLLGIWTLCGKHTVGATTYERCQPANITWATDNPADEWVTKTENNIVHNIHNGFSLSPLVRGGGGIRTCHVITPAGEDIALTAESDYPGLRRVLFNDDDDNLRSCGVNFGPLNANFQGSWVLYGKFNSRTIGFNVATQPITFSLPGTDGNNNGNPIILTTINHFARLGTEISITLSRKDYSEECHLQTPNGNTDQLGNAQINGVKVYNTRTNFVSCRVVIGPMAESLLGVWTLCGKHSIGSITYERCQPANITWATNNPADEWISRTEDNINHAIHNGFSLSPIVRGGGGIQTCHVITPAGEDIALTADSDYPGLQRVLFEDDVRACSVNFGPLNANFQGSWVLYGKFISRTIGFNVATQPMTLSLPGGTDGNNDGNPITLTTIDHFARLGTEISVTLSRKDYTEECHLQSPNGNTVQLGNAQINGVKVYNTRTNFVSCRVVIGPMAENLLGIWTLCGKHTVGATTYERCQPANITWATSNPADEWVTKTEDNIVHNIHNGFSLSPLVRGGGGIRTCHVITPAGEDIALTAESDYPGLRRVLFNDDDDNLRSCGVNFGPFNANFQGSWVLYGKFNSRTIGFNVATQPITFSLPGTDGNNNGNPITLTTINHFARLGSEISITLSRKDYTEECHLQTPNGNTVQVGNAQINGVKVYNTRTNFVSCRVVIGPMAENLLGIWTLCGKHTVGATTYERCQPANITWASSNPADEWTSRTEPSINHPIHNGFSLSSTVRGGGGIRTCHVVTPAGEDIALTADSDYPGLQRVVADNDVRACSVNFGPLNANFQGNWVLYGKFNSNSLGFNVASQPLTLSLSDGGAGGPNNLPTINHEARLGSKITITLSRKDYTEECHLQTPNGNTVQLENAQIHGVQVYNTRSNFVSCRVVIGPMEESLLGTWTLCGKHTVGANSNERCQPAKITWATTNPANEWLSTTNDNVNYAIRYGYSLSPVVRGGGGLRTCHVITPAGEDITLTADSDYPGLRRVNIVDDVTACSVHFGPFDENFLGRWMLYGTFNSGSIGFNVATQPISFSVSGSSTMVIWSSVVSVSLLILILGLLFGPKRNRDWTFERTRGIRVGIRSSFRKSLIKEPIALPIRYNGTMPSTSTV